MTTEEEIAVLERAARLGDCKGCTGNYPYDPKNRWHTTPSESVMLCGSEHIRAEIDHLRRTLEPPSAEEWAEAVRAYKEHVYSTGLPNSLVDSVVEIFALLDRWDRGRGK